MKEVRFQSLIGKVIRKKEETFEVKQALKIWFQSLIGKVIQRQFVSSRILYTKYSFLSSEKSKIAQKSLSVILHKKLKNDGIKPFL